MGPSSRRHPLLASTRLKSNIYFRFCLFYFNIVAILFCDVYRLIERDREATKKRGNPFALNTLSLIWIQYTHIQNTRIFALATSNSIRAVFNANNFIQSYLFLNWFDANERQQQKAKNVYAIYEYNIYCVLSSWRHNTIQQPCTRKWKLLLFNAYYNVRIKLLKLYKQFNMPAAQGKEI